MKCLIVDDNIIAQTTLQHLCKQLNYVEVVGTCNNALEAFNFIKVNDVDVILLDIEMPEMDGFELMKNLGANSPIIIFITDNSYYAAHAFALKVADYIVKPITTTRFIQAIEKAAELLKTQKIEHHNDKIDFIFIRDGNVVRKLNLDEVLYIEAMGDYVKIHTKTKHYAVHTKFKKL